MRNECVERATDLLVDKVDQLIDGGTLSKPIPPRLTRNIDETLITHGGSVRLASIFLIAYSLVDDSWDFDSVPTGIRGQYGDKRLAAALTERYVTFHKSITAFGENLGWKGNVKSVSLTRDPRFSQFVSALKQLKAPDRGLLLEHAAWRLFESRAVPKAIPALPAKYLTYSRATLLCESIVRIPSEGHLQQFLVAAFLSVHRGRAGLTVRTHHPHAADKFDDTVGDIEEFRDEHLVAAYEVTVRPDWKNRLPDLQKKIVRGGLQRYVVIAGGVTSDAKLFPAANLIAFTSHLSFDLAVVDIGEFFRVFCAELTTEELGKCFNLAYEFVRNVRLSGRSDFIDAYANAVEQWLDLPLP